MKDFGFSFEDVLRYVDHIDTLDIDMTDIEECLERRRNGIKTRLLHRYEQDGIQYSIYEGEK